MMKLLILSDSHGGRRFIRAAMEAHRGTLDAMIFLGDGLADLTAADGADVPVARITVRGNCDSFTLFSEADTVEEETVRTLDGVRFLILHGHTRRVKYGCEELIAHAAAVKADVVLFGHTHTPLNQSVPDPLDEDHRIVLFNPGSVGSGTEHSYGVIFIQDGKISAHHGRALA